MAGWSTPTATPSRSAKTIEGAVASPCLNYFWYSQGTFRDDLPWGKGVVTSRLKKGAPLTKVFRDVFRYNAPGLTSACFLARPRPSCWLSQSIVKLLFSDIFGICEVASPPCAAVIGVVVFCDWSWSEQRKSARCWRWLQRVLRSKISRVVGCCRLCRAYHRLKCTTFTVNGLAVSTDTCAAATAAK